YEKALAADDDKAIQLDAEVAEVERLILSREDIRARAVFRFFPAAADGDRLRIFTPDRGTETGSFLFGRQQRDGGVCLSDYVEPLTGGREDFIAMFATTVGPGVRGLAESLQAEGEYLKSHILQALAIEAAEGFAELLHKKIRTMWGIEEGEGTTMKDLFKARYRGIRVSFGYPACPRLEDQELLFALLGVSDRIGVHLTEGLMMDPESSVSALVLHHPEASYFSLGEADIELLEETLRVESCSG
ncbi:MAG: vitamin B12 dependent-methionine synthase activation domain-containing protein, partial [Candidatus Binatia bacterium]